MCDRLQGYRVTQQTGGRMIEPRKYQTEAVEAILEAQKRGVTRQLVSLPTGTGKTIIRAACQAAER